MYWRSRTEKGGGVLKISEIIENVDIVEYISEFIELEKRGEEYWGLSCFKDEKTPSFSVRPSSGKWYDFSTGQGGNIIDFLKLYYRCNLNKAVEIFKQHEGIKCDIEPQSKRLQATTIAKKYKTTPKTQKTSSSFHLPDNHMDQYEARNDKLKVWIDEGISSQSLERFQVKYDSFSNRLVYPIRDISGQIVNVGGRTLDPCYKEKKLRKYTYFYQWGCLDTIYGLYENMKSIKDKNEIILFEGAKSVMFADSYGIKNTAAILTSHLNPQQFKILIKLGVRTVFALDADVDVRNDVNIKKLFPYVTVEWVKNKNGLLGEKDSPIDKGLDIFNKLYDERWRLK